jgi:carboxymethylenebutenolidase
VTHTLHRQALDVATPDGTADSYLVRPAEGGPYPGVVLFMDAIGLRPRLEEMADRIAAQGHVVLVPNLFYRAGRAPVLPDLAARLQREDRAAVMVELAPLMQSLPPEVAAGDTLAYLDALEGQPGVAAGCTGTTGYCLGGGLALRAAAQLPDRVRAAASFHGGALAREDDPQGLQHLVGRIRGEVYAAHADNDASMPPDQVDRLERALTEGGVRHRTEVYEGAVHGFTMTDMLVHDAAAEQRHWDALLGLLARALVPG